MTYFLLIFGVASALGFYYFMQRKEAVPIRSSASISADIRCPSCKVSLHIEGMLDGAVFFGPGAIVFDCCHCHDRVYFAPYEDNVEVGILGCSPVVDPIPLESYAYPEGFEMRSETHDGILTIEIKERTWEIPRYGLWNERADIPRPDHAVKPDAR